ncbi:hypothetical protein EC973_003498 [Apophysomyces ossiformis]|uniref:MULE transposase domain-containing protein n=1 Tax=Apophysomyces ossiformis TaxID=679940 RepID=A0A8H7BHX6_9FUNG|nr:hypothetical protein EC973_003498 [Apophysomyces ossiformis]
MTKPSKTGGWYIHQWEAKHNHAIPKRRDIYAKYRVQPEEIELKIQGLFQGGLNAEAVYTVLKAENVVNITKKDLENRYYNLFKSEYGKKMFDYIVGLQEKQYIVNYTVKENKEIDMVFFCHKEAVIKARRMPESLIIDATYKLTAHKLVFINMVGTSNVKSKEHDTLATYEIAGAWVREEQTYCYEWNLMNDIAETDVLKRRLVKLDIEAMFQKIACTAETKEDMEAAVNEMKEYFLKDGVCKTTSKKKNVKDKNEIDQSVSSQLSEKADNDTIDLTLPAKSTDDERSRALDLLSYVQVYAFWQPIYQQG